MISHSFPSLTCEILLVNTRNKPHISAHPCITLFPNNAKAYLFVARRTAEPFGKDIPTNSPPPPPPVADKIEAPVPVSQFWRDASSEIFVEVLTPRIDRGKIIIYARIFETALSKHRGNCRPVLVSFCSFCLRGQTRKRWAKISCFYFDMKNNIVVLRSKNFGIRLIC